MEASVRSTTEGSADSVIISGECGCTRISVKLTIVRSACSGIVHVEIGIIDSGRGACSNVEGVGISKRRIKIINGTSVGEVNVVGVKIATDFERLFARAVPGLEIVVDGDATSLAHIADWIFNGPPTAIRSRV